MRKNSCLLLLSFVLLFSAHADEWKILRETEVDTEYVNISENEEGKCVLIASSSYSDGTLLFYCYAGLSDRQNLLNVYDNVKLNLSSSYEARAVTIASDNINNLRYSGILKLVNLTTDSPEYSNGYIIQKTHLYCDSWYYN